MAELHAKLATYRRAVPLELVFTTPSEDFREQHWLAIDTFEWGPGNAAASVALIDPTRVPGNEAERRAMVASGQAPAADHLDIRPRAARIEARAIPGENRIELNTERVAQLKLKLTAGLWNPAQPLVVYANGREVFRERVQKSLKTMLEEARLSGRRDRAVLAVVEFTIARPR